MARVNETTEYWKTVDVRVVDGTAYGIQQKEATCVYRTNSGVGVTSERRDEHRVVEIADL